MLFFIIPKGCRGENGECVRTGYYSYCVCSLVVVVVAVSRETRLLLQSLNPLEPLNIVCMLLHQRRRDFTIILKNVLEGLQVSVDGYPDRYLVLTHS